MMALLAPALAGGAAAQSDAKPAGRRYAAGQYIVQLRDGVALDDVINQRVNGRGAVRQRYSAALNGFAADLNEDAASALAADPRVTAIMPDFKVYASAQTTPSGVSRVGGLSSAAAKIDGVDERVNVDVAILDTGITAVSDLNVAGGYDCTGNNSWADGNGHGTHVAGTVGALDNGDGVVGVAPGARLWSVRVLGADGSGTGSQILCGINWVYANASTIEVVNMSLGGATTYQDDNNCGYTNGDAIHQAICKIVNAGVTVVVAAGNDGKDAAGFFPAQYNEVITVSALVDTDGKAGGAGAGTNYGVDDSLATFSNYGADVDLIAPGYSIYSTLKTGGYGYMSGTSMASPHVAGAAALYKAVNPSASPAQIRSALISAGNNGWSGDRDSSKEPLLSVAAIGGSTPVNPPPSGVTTDAQVVSVSAPASLTLGQSGTITATVRNNGSATAAIAVALNETPGGFSQTKSVSLAAGATSAVSFTWATTSATTTGAHTFTATATVSGDSNAGNNSGSASTTVSAQSSTGATMSVSAMTLTKTTYFSGWRLSSRVYVKSNGVAVASATVTVKWTYANGATYTASAKTNASGYASLSRTVTAKGTYKIEVTNVVKTGMTYNTAGNVVSVKTLTIS